jgi:hypothetical protein
MGSFSVHPYFTTLIRDRNSHIFKPCYLTVFEVFVNGRLESSFFEVFENSREERPMRYRKSDVLVVNKYNQ